MINGGGSHGHGGNGGGDGGSGTGSGGVGVEEAMPRGGGEEGGDGDGGGGGGGGGGSNGSDGDAMATVVKKEHARGVGIQGQCTLVSMCSPDFWSIPELKAPRTKWTTLLERRGTGAPAGDVPKIAWTRFIPDQIAIKSTLDRQNVYL